MTRWVRIGIFVLLVPMLGGLVALIWWWYVQQNKKTPDIQSHRVIVLPEVDVEEPTPTEESRTLQPDDLRQVEGIGPKITSVLQQAGIFTYAQLAVTETSRLRQILNQAGVRAAPDTWPDQAKLAAVGDWESLKTFQAELKGGRRV